MSKVIIFSAPSGSGKSTIINRLMQHPELKLAIHLSVAQVVNHEAKSNMV